MGQPHCARPNAQLLNFHTQQVCCTPYEGGEMDIAQTDAVACLPDEMLRFILQTGNHSVRSGQLLSHSHSPIHTPHYVATTSRGVIPHLAQDILTKHTAISAVYFGLEDCEHFPRLASVTHSLKLTTGLR